MDQRMDGDRRRWGFSVHMLFSSGLKWEEEDNLTQNFPEEPSRVRRGERGGFMQSGWDRGVGTKWTAQGWTGGRRCHHSLRGWAGVHRRALCRPRKPPFSLWDPCQRCSPRSRSSAPLTRQSRLQTLWIPPLFPSWALQSSGIRLLSPDWRRSFSGLVGVWLHSPNGDWVR